MLGTISAAPQFLWTEPAELDTTGVLPGQPSPASTSTTIRGVKTEEYRQVFRDMKRLENLPTLVVTRYYYTFHKPQINLLKATL